MLNKQNLKPIYHIKVADTFCSVADPLIYGASTTKTAQCQGAFTLQGATVHSIIHCLTFSSCQPMLTFEVSSCASVNQSCADVTSDTSPQAARCPTEM